MGDHFTWTILPPQEQDWHSGLAQREDRDGEWV